MKLHSKFLFVAATVALFFSACMPTDDIFDESLLIGKWQSGTLHYRYDLNLSGVSWDTSEDINESEGQAFTWELKSSNLTHIHIMEKGGLGVPKIYTVTKLTETTLEYADDFKKKYVFTKIK